MSEEPHDLDELAGYLNALAHPGRLDLIAQLRVARTIREIRLRPSREESSGNPDRAISRTAVERHLQTLRAIGVVAGRPSERDGRAVEEYLLQRARLFQVLERLRELMQLRPLDTVEIEATEAAAGPAARELPDAPSLVVLSGPAEGQAHVLGKGATVVGRAAPSDVLLDWDPFVSAQHLTLRAQPGGARVLSPHPGAKNPVRVNWSLVRPGEERRLRHGDVVSVGHTLLLYREPA